MLELKNISRNFDQGGKKIDVLNKINLSLSEGEIVGLLGASGTGKSTLLHIAGLLDKPTSGSLFLNKEDMTQKNEHDRTLLRRDLIGFVYQFHYLLPEFSALENVVLPQIIAKKNKKQATQEAKELLSLLNLADRMEHYPSKLSGGEQQRVALARALSNKPKLLLADEPTGNLDPKTTKILFSHMLEILRLSKVTALIATHDMTLAKMMDRIVTLKEGQINEVEPQEF
jgi:lipoprotein-releasing system ATP-binding protein